MLAFKWLTTLISTLLSAGGIGVLVCAILTWRRAARIRKRYPKTFRRHWKEILKQEIHDVCHTVPVIATMLSTTCGPYARVKRVFDSDSADLAAAWEVMKKAGLPRGEVEDLDDVRRLLHEWLVAEESGVVSVERHFLVAKVGPLVVALLYYQYFPAWHIVYISYYALDQTHASVGLARDSLKTRLLVSALTLRGLRAILSETSDLSKYRDMRMMLTSGDSRRAFRIIGLPNYRQPPISPEEARNLVPILLVCCWIDNTVTYLTMEEAIGLLQFMRDNYAEAFEHLYGAAVYLECLDRWYEDVVRDVGGTVPLWTSEQDIPAETLARLTGEDSSRA